MKINTFLKYNLKNEGNTEVWLKDFPIISDEELQGFLPKPQDKFSANVAYSSHKINSNTYFFSTISKFGEEDEFGRLSIEFCQGILVKIDLNVKAQSINLSDIFLQMLCFHENNYGDLGVLLKKLAQNPTENNIEQFRNYVINASNISKLNAEFDKKLVQQFTEEVKKLDSKTCIKTDFPWSKYLGGYILANLQQESEGASSIAGGYHKSYADFNFVSSTEAFLSGFQNFNFNKQMKIANVQIDKTIISDKSESNANKSESDFAGLEEGRKSELITRITFQLPNLIISIGTFVLVLYTLTKIEFLKFFSFPFFEVGRSNLYFILILWLLFPSIWFYIEPKFRKVEQLDESEESEESEITRSKQLPNSENFFKTLWLCGSFLLIISVIESK